MILNIWIKNFRSFKDEVSFTMVAEASKSKEENFCNRQLGEKKDDVRVLNTALIFGANASGKSNLLKALAELAAYIGKHRLRVGEKIPAYNPFKFDLQNQKEPTEIAIDFIGRNDVKYRYEIKFDLNNVVHENLTYWPKNKSVVLFTRILPRNVQDITHQAKIGSTAKAKVIDVFHNQPILSKFGLDTPDPIITSVYLYITGIQFIEAFDSNTSINLRSEIGEKIVENDKLLEKINALIVLADTGLKGIELAEKELSALSPTLHRKVEHYKEPNFNLSGVHTLYNGLDPTKNLEYLSLSEESNGTRAIFTMGGKMIDLIDRGGVLFIDELESSLHPFLSKMLISLFQNKRINKFNSQLIFTTHETTLLDKTLFRKDQIWLAEKAENGATDLFSLQDYSDVREDTPFDKWYLAGKFGGIPNIASLESLYPIDEEA